MALNDKLVLKKLNGLLRKFCRQDERYKTFSLPLKSMKDIQYIPVSHRDDLAAFAGRHSLKGAFNVTATSGSSASRLLIAHSRKSHAVHVRRLVAVYKSIGIMSKDLCLNLCSYSLNSGGRLMEASFKSLGVGVIPLGELRGAEKVAEAVAITRQLHPTVINSYTNQLFPLFSALGKDHQVRVCIVNGEPLYPSFKAQIEAMAGVRIYNHYGAMEFSGFAIARKPDDEYMRVFDDGLYLEVRDDDGRVRETGRGALLVTDLDNDVMPFIRYELGDRVELVRRKDGLYLKVLGRLTDSILLNGEVYSCQDVVGLFQAALGHPDFFLLVEKDAVTYQDKMVLNVLSQDAGAWQKVQMFLKNQSALEGLTRLAVYRGEMPKTSTGKFRHLVDARAKMMGDNAARPDLPRG
ncbi:MAG: hypothetical protein WCI27_09890 [Candidatus Omnitrophota bacterium]